MTDAELTTTVVADELRDMIADLAVMADDVQRWAPDPIAVELLGRARLALGAVVGRMTTTGPTATATPTAAVVPIR